MHDDPVVEETEVVQIQLLSDEPERIQITGFTGNRQLTSIVIKDDDSELHCKSCDYHVTSWLHVHVQWSM